MPTEVDVSPDARQGLTELKNRVISGRIHKLLRRLKNWPNVSGCKPLSGDLAGKYRMRTGDYRLQFRVETKVEQVEEKQLDKGKAAKMARQVEHHLVTEEKIGHRDGFVRQVAHDDASSKKERGSERLCASSSSASH